MTWTVLVLVSLLQVITFYSHSASGTLGLLLAKHLIGKGVKHHSNVLKPIPIPIPIPKLNGVKHHSNSGEKKQPKVHDVKGHSILGKVNLLKGKGVKDLSNSGEKNLPKLSGVNDLLGKVNLLKGQGVKDLSNSGEKKLPKLSGVKDLLGKVIKSKVNVVKNILNLGKNKGPKGAKDNSNSDEKNKKKKIVPSTIPEANKSPAPDNKGSLDSSEEVRPPIPAPATIPEPEQEEFINCSEQVDTNCSSADEDFGDNDESGTQPSETTKEKTDGSNDSLTQVLRKREVLEILLRIPIDGDRNCSSAGEDSGDNDESGTQPSEKTDGGNDSLTQVLRKRQILEILLRISIDGDRNCSSAGEDSGDNDESGTQPSETTIEQTDGGNANVIQVLRKGLILEILQKISNDDDGITVCTGPEISTSFKAEEDPQPHP